MLRTRSLATRLAPSARFGSSWAEFVMRATGPRALRTDDAFMSDFPHHIPFRDFVEVVGNIVLAQRIYHTRASILLDGHDENSADELPFPALRDRICSLYKIDSKPYDIVNQLILNDLPFVSQGNAIYKLRPILSEIVLDLSEVRKSSDKYKNAHQEEISFYVCATEERSAMRQLLHDLRYPFPGAVAWDNASTLLQSCWWTHRIPAPIVRVCVVPGETGFSQFLDRKYGGVYTNVWGDKVNFIFEDFHK